MAYLTGNVNIDIRNATMEKIAGVTRAEATPPLIGGALGALGGMLGERLGEEEDDRNYIGAAINGFLHGGVGSLASRGFGLNSNIGDALIGGMYGTVNSLMHTPSKTDIDYNTLREIKSFDNLLKEGLDDDPELKLTAIAAREGLIHGVDPVALRQKVIDKISF